MAKARECGSRGPRSAASGWTGPGCVTSRVCHLPRVSPPECVRSALPGADLRAALEWLGSAVSASAEVPTLRSLC